MKTRLELYQILSAEYRNLLEDPEHFEIELLSLLAQFSNETKALLMTIYRNELNKMTDEEMSHEYNSMLSYAETIRGNDLE